MPDFTPLTPKVALGVAAHPDDLDFGAAGTLARWATEGTKVYYLILTDGSKGSSDPAMTGTRLTAIRKAEQQAAMERLGGAGVEFLDYPDAHLEVSMDLKRDIVRVIRARKPDVVITMDPTTVYAADRGFINHPDHRAAGQATLDAVFPLARDHMTFPELHTAGHPAHITPTVLLINFEDPNYFSDVSNFVDQKLAVMAAHASQGFAGDTVQNRAKELMSKMGGQAGYAYAEAFVRIDIT